MRGTDTSREFMEEDGRITPACAGNRCSAGVGFVRHPDHPRVCGEQRFPCRFPSTQPGSPPRVRGTDPEQRHRGILPGITPACAGNRQPCSWCRRRCPDHPRVCGEQPRRMPQRRCGMGSPPRVRGTARKAKVGPPAYRITPACAGNRYSFSFSSFFSRDHPRVCGEQMHELKIFESPEGSPPRVRGTGAAPTG